MDALVLPLQPTRQGTPHVIDTGDVPGAEKVLLYKAHAVFNRAFAFRVCLIAYPELEFLLCTEILKDTSLYDFTVRFTGDKHGVLIYDQNRWPALQLTETAINRLAGFRGIVFMIL